MRLIPKAQSGRVTKWHRVRKAVGSVCAFANHRIASACGFTTIRELPGEEERWHRSTYCVLAVSFRRSSEDLNWICPGAAGNVRRPTRRGRSPGRPTPCAKVTRPATVRVNGDDPSYSVHSFVRDRTAPCRRRPWAFRRALNLGRLPQNVSHQFGSLCRIRSLGGSPFAVPRDILGPMSGGLG